MSCYAATLLFSVWMGLGLSLCLQCIRFFAVVPWIRAVLWFLYYFVKISDYYGCVYLPVAATTATVTTTTTVISSKLYSSVL